MFDTSKNLRNRDLENKGAWMEYDDDSRFLVARRTNPDYKAFISKSWRNNERVLQSKGNLKQADKIADEFLLEATATYLLLDWEGIVNHGAPVAYTPELAMQVLEEHDDLRQMIEEFADNRENYIGEQDKSDAENLGESSAGAPSGEAKSA